MLKQTLLLAALVSMTTALSCYDCIMFNQTEMTEDQKVTMESLVTQLAKPRCDSQEEVTTKACQEGQDQCQKVEVSSMLGGDKLLEGHLLQCGIAEAISGVCPGYQAVAQVANFPLVTCNTTGCLTDNCNGAGSARQTSFVLIISAFFYLFTRV